MNTRTVLYSVEMDNSIAPGILEPTNCPHEKRSSHQLVKNTKGVDQATAAC